MAHVSPTLQNLVENPGARILRGTLLAAALLAFACGSSAPAEPASPEPATSPPPSDPEAPVDEETLDPATGNAESTDEPAIEPDEADAEPEQREVVYRVKGGSLTVEVDGVKLEPKAEPIRKKGGWGVRVTVKATATDDRMHRVLSPENGPLAFFAEIEHKGNIRPIADERKGQDEEFITAGESTEMVREFPGKGQSPLWSGQSLTLQVGLWGLAAEAERRRPVRKLFVLKMVVGNHKPQPVISAPQ